MARRTAAVALGDMHVARHKAEVQDLSDSVRAPKESPHLSHHGSPRTPLRLGNGKIGAPVGARK
jgi:hypothetical protein